MFYRYKKGRGFTYQDEKGKTVGDKKLRKWFESLVIPPAWTEVQISENKSADLLATGRDAKERKQYIYHPNYRARREARKFNRIVAFADQLEHMRRVTGQHLRHEENTRNRVMATLVRLLETAFFRPGSEAYSNENHSYGLTTLRSKHLTADQDKVIFSYNGKSGKRQQKEIENEKLVRVITELDNIPGYEIFKYYDESGQKVNVKSDDLNAYIREHMGEDFSAKDFRTWSGSMIAAIALNELGAVSKNDQKLLDENIRKAVIRVSEKLGNTPAVARDSYIDPRIIDEYIEGKTLNYFKNEIDKLLDSVESLSREEVGVLYLLKNELD
ncbi:DNA topoisomerase IB [Psychroflexus lacisalsi]|jgi:DNA topoisomerase-1|uniref:DNA topoisomerase n=1 Tax=Psychroflexus lacisalsi TaxID=503928 RepID=A0ABP3VKQ5_9FLAO|nr:DNA topoisomerase IB [Psychroflexus lacisalsi]MBZ9619710.1 DNA topoisomerase IB [Psychroflexus lacisalsi]